MLHFEDKQVTGTAVSLQQMLVARECRAKRQKQLLHQWQIPLLCVTAVAPGAIKRNPLINKIMDYAHQAILHLVNEHHLYLSYQDHQDLITGEEYYYCISTCARSLKQVTIELEQTHPLGRLWDIDIFDLEGYLLSRQQLNMPPRRCLLCENNAHECARARKHSIDCLQAKMIQMMIVYENNATN